MTVSAIDRCLAVIECLAGQSRGLELSSIAQGLGLPKSATHRILQTLAARGWVTRDAGTENYVLSLRFAMLAFRDLDSRVITDVAQRVLDGLARRTREYARIAVAEGDTLVWVARAQGAEAGLRYDPDMGVEVVLHTTATGRAWLASMLEGEALRIVATSTSAGNALSHPETRADLDEVRRTIAETRARGWAISREEAAVGIIALAVVFHEDPEPGSPVAGTLSIAGPAARMDESRHPELVSALRAAARELEKVWRLRSRQLRETRPRTEPVHVMS